MSELSAEERAKLIARTIILGVGSPHSVADIERQDRDIVYEVTFAQVWRPIYTALLMAGDVFEARSDRGEPVVIIDAQ